MIRQDDDNARPKSYVNAYEGRGEGAPQRISAQRLAEARPHPSAFGGRPLPARGRTRGEGAHLRYRSSYADHLQVPLNNPSIASRII